ncbi:hypothetical protein GUJ93_ZPchr0010g8363 [Zizania palustris]|uniref:Uncharacterized protein n=1 Tax=Zizania palustris TaxID=103762 RepID=A0A8J5WFU3_ZIZPA|nr:hypothetical protein GUJ93_ZPchr0010g8363 [Zizania palustris]
MRNKSTLHPHPHHRDGRRLRPPHPSREYDGGDGGVAGAAMTDVLSKGREACYKARDAFYSCVEKHADKKATEIATMGLLYPAACNKSRANFVNSCRPSWVRHFDRQYCAKKRVQRLLDGDEDRRGPISLPSPTRSINSTLLGIVNG